jgi:hypothetical protein
MLTSDQIANKKAAFRDWLSGQGAQVLEPTNEFELVRFKSGDATSIIYRKKTGAVSFVGDAKLAWHAFSTGRSFRTTPPTTRRKRMTPMVRTIRARDGDLCFYCQKPVSDDNESVEHLVAVAHGGPNHLSNLFLAHKKCNGEAGHLSAPEKIARHVAAVMKRDRIEISSSVEIRIPDSLGAV